MKKNIFLGLVLLMSFVSGVFGETLKLDEDKVFKINGGSVTIKQGTAVTLHSNGSISKGILAKNFKYKMGKNGAVVFGAGKELSFTDKGNLVGGYVDQEATINTPWGNLKINKGGWISFYENGRLHRLDLNGNQILKGMPGNKSITIKSFIIFSDKGQPGSINLTMDQKISDYIFSQTGAVEFHNTGHVKTGMLAKEYKKKIGKLKLKEKKYAAGVYHNFNEKGEIQ